jgi:light-harvesting complex I chlorophyll a/b binding protein 3
MFDRSDFGFDPLGLMDPVNAGGFVTPQWLAYSEVIATGACRNSSSMRTTVLAPRWLSATVSAIETHGSAATGSAVWCLIDVQ